MDKKDTKYIDLNTTLSAVGKAVFVNFYYDFKNASLSDHEIAEKLLRENLIIRILEYREPDIFLQKAISWML